MPARPSRTNPATAKSLGKPSTKSREKANASADRATVVQGDDPVPLTPDGYPMTMIEVSAAELIPTGNFANVSVGPAKIRHWIDPREEDPIPQTELANMARALNLLAEVVEIDVIAVQRNLTLESLQGQVAEETSSK